MSFNLRPAKKLYQYLICREITICWLSWLRLFNFKCRQKSYIIPCPPEYWLGNCLFIDWITVSCSSLFSGRWCHGSIEWSTQQIYKALSKNLLSYVPSLNRIIREKMPNMRALDPDSARLNIHQVFVARCRQRHSSHVRGLMDHWNDLGH